MFSSAKGLIKKFVVALTLPLFRWHAAYANADLPTFANRPKNLQIELPRRIRGAERMFFGDDVAIGPGSLLIAQTYYPTEVMREKGRQHALQHFEPKLTIGHRVTSTGNLTLCAMSDITIEDDVMIASNVMIADGQHGFENANEPYKFQKMFRIAPIIIGRGSWIGQNVVIMPGVAIGALAIIGANSVVTRSVPAKTIAVGNPARVVKVWDDKLQKWKPTA